MEKKSIQSINQSIEFNEKVELLFDELSERTEMACAGNACTGNASACLIN